MDPRDTPTWVAIEITHQGELKVEEGSFEVTIRCDLGVGPEFPLFIPARIYERDGKQVVIWLMDGYVFVGAGLPETTYFALEHKSYVERIVSTAGTKECLRTLQTLPDSAIQNLRKQLQLAVTSDLKIGERVTVLEGNYQGLEGEVIGLADGQVQVKIELRSLKATISVSRDCVSEASKNT